MQEITMFGKKKAGLSDADFALDFEGVDGSKVFTNTGVKPIVAGLINGGPTISRTNKINGLSSGLFGNIGAGCLYLPTSTSFPGDFTIETWLNHAGSGNPTYSGGFQMLVSLNRILLEMAYCLCLFEGKLAFKSVSATGVYGTIAAGGTIVPLGIWNHLAFTRKNGIVKLWLNGKLEATSAAWTNAFSSLTAFYIGNCHDQRVAGTGGYCGLNGNADRFRMYSRCLYDADFIPAIT